MYEDSHLEMAFEDAISSDFPGDFDYFDPWEDFFDTDDEEFSDQE